MLSRLIGFVSTICLLTLPVCAEPADSLSEARALLQQHDYTRAASLLLVEIKSHRDNAKAHYFLAEAYHKLRRDAECQQELNEAITNDHTGKIAALAKESLAKLQASTKTQSQAPHYVQAYVDPSIPPPGITLNINNRIQLPPMSKHMDAGHWDWFRRMQKDYVNALDGSTKRWQSGINGYTSSSNTDDATWRAYHLHRVEQCKQALSASLLECDAYFLNRVEEINESAERLFKKQNGNKELSAADKLEAEGAQRYRALKGQIDAAVKEVQATGENKKHILLDEKSAAVSKATPEDVKKVSVDFDERIAVIDSDTWIEIGRVRQQYSGKLQEVLDTYRNLASANFRSESAKLMPMGKNNYYSRSYQTFGDPTGSKLPLLAEPKALK